MLIEFPPVDSWIYVPVRVEDPAPSGVFATLRRLLGQRLPAWWGASPTNGWTRLYGRVIETEIINGTGFHVRVDFGDGPPLRIPARWARPANIVDVLANLVPGASKL